MNAEERASGIPIPTILPKNLRDTLRREIAQDILEAEQAAFEEGQREMRERAANSIKGTLTFLSCSHDGHGLEKIIRALPLTPRGGESK